MKYYVMADLHGRYDLLEKAFEKITEHSIKNPNEGSMIITLGDYIDRGPDSKKIIDFLIDRQDGSQLGSCLICLKGNHEDMMVQVVDQPDFNMKLWWYGNGGEATWNSYGGWEGIDREHVTWMRNLPYYYETEKQLFVHAGVPQKDMNLPPKRLLLKEEMIWMLYDRTDGRGWKGKHVVHGHHQSENNPQTWSSESGGRTALDCWAYHTGRLVVGVFDDTQGPALEYIEVKL